MKKGLKKVLKLVLPLALGLLILWLLYRHMDVEAFRHTLREDTNLWIILGASMMGTVGNTIRGLRWQMLNKRLDENTSLINSILTVHGNYGVSLAIPRMGEVWRVATMSLYSGIGVGKLVGTLLVDRVFDIIAILVMLLIGLGVNAPFFSGFISTNVDLDSAVRSSVWLYIAVGLLAALTIAVALWFVKSAKGHAAARNILQGLKTISQLDQPWLFYLYTIGIWGSYFLQFYFCFFAFSFTSHMGMSVALLCFVMASVGVMVPTQGGMGGWHFVVIYTLMAFGLDQVHAQNFALIVHTFQAIFWTGSVGLVSILLLPIINRKKNIVNQ
ncbi:MAG: lysylphosphatidylglycerol synthase transmembrane domain-containing protein [Porphyromonas sp.]|nr:lysylphosphatidylglycerol synthase transmembrane domain-containing protein [Porphyromonas sp.]